MLAELTVALMQGVSQVLIERFLKNRETSASTREVLKQVERLEILQIEDRRTAAQLRKEMTAIISRTDGLEVRARKIVFTPTATATTPESALLNLDLEIGQLRAGLDTDRKATPRGTTSTGCEPKIPLDSILYGLDEEIAKRRQGETSRGPRAEQ